MIIGLQGLELGKDEAQFIVENNIGGVILFSRNYESLEQLHKLITDVQRLRYKTEDKTPIFVSADMEGGRVQRFKDPFTVWPPFQKLGDLDSSSQCFNYTNMQGQELKAVGINMNYSPCVDVLFNEKNEVIGDRALSKDPETVARLSSALVRGFIKAEVLAVAKHFPGHGYTTVDSHFDLPVDNRSLKEIDELGDLEPFKKVIKSRVPFLMTGHIQYPSIDKDFPVTLSKIFLKDILRTSLRYRGLIMTDDLDMKALTKTYSVEEIPILALNAGANVLLYCNEPDSPRLGINSISKALSDKQVSSEDITANAEAIVALKKRLLTQPVEPFSLDKVKSILGNKEHKQFAQDLAQGNLSPDA